MADTKKKKQQPNKKVSTKKNTPKNKNNNIKKTTTNSKHNKKIREEKIELLEIEDINKETVEKIKNEIVENKENKKDFKDTFIKNLFLVTFITFLIEIIFKVLSNFEIISYSSLRILISTFVFSLIITFLSSLVKKRWIKNTINLIYIFLYSIYAWLQIGFINYLGVYISFHTSSQFGAVKDYIKDYIESFKPSYYLLFVPFIIVVIILVIMRKKEYIQEKITAKKIWVLSILALCLLMYLETIFLPFMQNKLQIKSNKDLFMSPDVPTVAVNQFGVTVFGILDFKSFVAPTEDVSTVFSIKNNTENIKVSREISSSLMEIANNENNKKYTDLNNYFVSQSVTDFNDYTGVFEGKNVVVVLMESVNDAFINENYFPNFTKLYNEGWHWVNNYSPRNSCATGNNEFSAMTSLYSIYNTCTSNVYKNNTYFESIFGLFNDKGYTTTSYHDFVEWYYKRSVIHPNMGSSKYYGAKDLDIKTASYYGEWPNDEEFFEKAFDIILNKDDDKPFMAWLTTVTSHQPYNNSSTYGDLYRKYFEGEGYSKNVSRYLSKLKVVDNALGIMIDKLSEAKVLDDTVIVLLADHYPYGLNNSYIKEIIDYDLSDYDIEKTPLVIYNPEMTPEEHTEYNSYINLVPTIANLMNLDYDPRLYMGTDLFSESYESRVVFADGSWKNEDAYYNASTGKIKYYGDIEYTEEEIKEINNNINLKITISSKAIKNNYFNYLEKKLDEYNDKNKLVEEKSIDDISNKND